MRRNKQLEKEVDESRQRLSQLNAELESAVQANRNYQSELIKVKSLSEQLTEQIEIITRDKRRLQGRLPMLPFHFVILSLSLSLDEMDVALNQISDLNTRLVDLDRQRKQLEAEKLSFASTIDEYREQLHIEITKYNILNASIDKLRSDLEKKIAEKEEELEGLR